MTTPEEARYYSDVHTIEQSKALSKESARSLGVLAQNYDRYMFEKKGIDYLEDLLAGTDGKVWAKAKKQIDIDYICEKLELKESDIKEIWKNQIKENEKQQKDMRKDYEGSKPKEIAKFDFELKQIECKTLDDVKKIVQKNFPSIWFETKACLSVCATLSLKNLNGCPSLNLVGNPSGEKTTALSFFYGQDKTYISDDFTPRAFVSHSSNVPKEELESIDLLPKLKNKILITPELAPLFEAPKDKLIDNFAMLTRVLDGEGLNRDSGTHGHRGYSGDYKFAWLGATTPLKASVWNVMGKIGNRLFFLNMKDKNRQHKDYIEMFRGRAYEEKVKECRGAIRSFLDNYYKENPERELQWDAEQDIFLLNDIVKYAQLLSKLRGTLMLWKSEDGDYQHSFPIVEEPPRAINSLFNLAKGHALIHGRRFLKKEDLEIVKSVAFSSMPHDRFEFLKLLKKHEGRLTTQNIQAELSCSDDTARRTMETFKILGVVNLKNLDFSGGRPMYYVEIKPEFAELLTDTQVLNDEEKDKTQDLQGVRDGFSVENFLKNQKNQEKIGHAQVRNDEDYTKTQQNNPVLNNKERGNTPKTDKPHQIHPAGVEELNDKELDL